MIYKSSSAYSFGKVKKDTQSSFVNNSNINNPDFNKYQGDIIIKPTKGYAFSKGEKFKKIPISPGPGSYNTNNSTIGVGVPKYSLYKSDKETEIGHIVKKNKNAKLPGVGFYTITEENCEKTIFNSTQSNYFSKGEKLKLIDNHVPGVGKYNTYCSTDFGKGNKNKYSMSKTERSDIVDKSKTSSSAKNKGDIKALEPGKYNIDSTFGKGGTKPLLRGKPKEVKPFNIPGPGEYNSDNAKIKTLRKNPTTCLGFGKRTDITASEKKKNVPGFQYNIKSEFDVSNKSKIKANTFSKSERMQNRKTITPGPGAYYLPCSFGNVPDYERVQESKFRKI